MKSKYLCRIMFILSIIFIFLIIAKIGFTPKGFGNHGSIFYKFYRLSAIDDEIQRPLVNFTNSSCLKCHPVESEMQLSSVHKSLSCEFCHGPGASHINNKGKLIGKAIIFKNKDLIKQCLRCHNGNIVARKMRKTIKTVLFPEHLKNMKVNQTHTCSQCHIVHAPLKNIKHFKKFFAKEGF